MEIITTFPNSDEKPLITREKGTLNFRHSNRSPVDFLSSETKPKY